MVLNRTSVFLFVFLSFLFSGCLKAVVKGSETVVSVESTASFLSLDSDNTMLGFGWFKNGFTFEDSSTTCTFDSIYPVSGTATFNGGSLYLIRDLDFQNVSHLKGPGEIYANNYTLELCSSITELYSTYTFHDITLALNGDLIITSTVIFEGDCVIDGSQYNIYFEDEGVILVAQDSTLAFDDIILEGLSGRNISCQDDSSKLIFHNIDWVQDGDFIFDTGSIEFLNCIRFRGSNGFFYESSQTSTIGKNTRWTIVDGLTLQIGRKEVVDYVEPLYFIDHSSILRLDSCSLIITDSGIGLTRGSFELDRDVYIDVASSTTTYGMILGDGQDGHDFSMILDSGASVHLIGGCWVYNNYDSTGRLHALSEESRCIRYGDSKFYVMRNWTIPPMVFKVASGSPTSIVVDGAFLNYNNTNIAFDGASFNVSGKEMLPGFKLDGDKMLFMNMGELPMPIYVSGSGNKIYGSGKVSGPIILQDSDSVICCYLDGSFLDNISLAGGTLMLMGEFNFEGDSVLTGSGTVSLSEYRFNFGSKDSEWSSDIEWQGVNGNILMSANVDLIGTWTFSGTTILDGGGNIIDLNGGKIVIDEDSKLILRNVCLKSISEDNIKCLGDTGALELDNVSWIQSDHVLFDTGSISIVNFVDFIGSYSFLYDSSQTSTINERSKWTMSDGIIFTVGRKESFYSAEPIYFEDDSSILKIYDSSLVITSSGMMLTRGILEFDGDTYLDAISTVSDGGLILGNGIAEDDATMLFYPGASFKFRTGWWVYNTIKEGLLAASESASIIRYGTSKMYGLQDFTVPTMTLKVHSGLPTTLMLDGKMITYDNTHLNFGTVEFDIIAKEYGSAVYLLDGLDSLYLTKGVFPCPVYVNGTGNQLHGTGDMAGPLLFTGVDSEISCNLNGSISTSPTLNGGKIILTNDLKFGPGISIVNSGQIDLSSYRLILGVIDFTWNSDISWIGDGGAINLKSNIDLSATWTFNEDCIINGRGHVLDISDGNIVVASGSRLTLNDIIIHSVSNDKIICIDDYSVIELDNVTWALDGHFTFTTGCFEINNDVDFVGSYSFVYDSSQTSTIKGRSNWTMDDGITLKIGRRDSYLGEEPIYFENDSAVMKFNDSSLVITSSGMTLTRGIMKFEGDVSLDILSSTTNGGLILGSGIEEDDAVMIFDPGASLKFKSGWLVYNSSIQNGLVAPSESALIIRYGDSKMYGLQDFIVPTMVLKVFSGMPATVMEEGKIITYNNSHLVFGTVEFDMIGKEYGGAVYLLDGGDSIYLTKGVFPCPVYVNGTGNQLHGSGDMAGPIMLVDSDSELIFNLNGTVLYSPLMNGGKLTLLRDLSFGPDISLSDAGEIDISNNRLSFGTKDFAWSSDTAWFSDGGAIDLKSDLDLKATWTFNGICKVNGHGHVFDLNEGDLVVTSGSKLILHDVIIRSVSGNKIRCLYDDSVLELNNVHWDQDDHFTFTTGSMSIRNEVDFVGSYSFVYDSSQTSTISSRSKWIMRNGILFEFGKKDSYFGAEPIYFEDESSVFKLCNSSFIVTSSGATLTRGKIEIDGDVSFEILSPTIEGGLIFGDGGVENDVVMYFDPGASLKFKSGWFIYNSTEDAFVVSSESAQIIRYADSKFHGLLDFTLPMMGLKVHSGMPLTTMVEGKLITYDNSHLVFSTVEFDIVAKEIGNAFYLLDGDGSLYLTKGIFPCPISVSETGNQLRGTGDMAGNIFLEDVDSELTCHLNGTILMDIQPNGGKIILTNDLWFGPEVVLLNAGQIDLTSYRLSLGTKKLTWNSDVAWTGNGGAIDLKADVDLASTWTFEGICTLNGKGHVFDLSDGALVVNPGSKLILNNIILHSVSGNNLRCLDYDSSIELDNVTWAQDGHFTFTTGSIEIENQVDFVGSYSFVYDSSQTSTISSRSSWSIKDGMIFEIGRKEAIDFVEPIYFENDTSLLFLEDCSFVVTSSGVNFSNGTIEVDGEVQLSFMSSTTTNGFTMGTGQDGEDLSIKIRSGASLKFLTGCWVYNNYNSTGKFTALSSNARLLRYSDSVVYVMNDWTLPSMTVVNMSGFPVTIVPEGINFNYDNVHMIIGSIDFDFNGKQFGYSTFSLIDDDCLTINKGVYPLSLNVIGTGNYLRGSGDMGASLVLQDESSELICHFNGSILVAPILNGGKLLLTNDLNLGPGVDMSGAGKIDLYNNRFIFGPTDQTLASEVLWRGDGGVIELGSTLTLHGTWTFKDSCVINGNGNTLDLNAIGHIVVDEGSTLKIRDIRLEGISGTQLRCLDSEGTIILESVNWLQDDDYQFLTGKMQWKRRVKMSGKKKFSYRSDQVSTIFEDSRLTLDLGFTFSYDPALSASKDLLAFADETATLVLNGATLYATVTGLDLSVGKLLIKNESNISSETELIISTTIIDGEIVVEEEIEIDEGITFGNGVDDLFCEVSVGAKLNIIGGTLRYKNLLSSSLFMINSMSMIRLYPDTQLILDESLILGAGGLQVDPQARIIVADGKELLGSVFTLSW